MQNKVPYIRVWQQDDHTFKASREELRILRDPGNHLISSILKIGKLGPKRYLCGQLSG